jgi:glycosyltransferase involved in cell wall biosynthesis
MEKNEQIKSVINQLDNKEFGMYFFVHDTLGNPTAGIANIYEHVKVLNDLGYKASILHEKNDYKGVATWLGDEYMKLPHVSIESQQLKVVSSDFIFIPEIFSTLMDQIKEFPCKKVVISQSYSYALELLPIGKSWVDFGFKDVITTSDVQADYLKTLFPSLNAKVIPVSIPEYFSPSKEIPKPIVAIHTRDQADTLRIIKSFYLQFPQYKWVTFRDLRGLPRKEFAEELKNSAVAVWVDDASGFGTFPLEAIECNVPVIGKLPTLIPEYILNGENIRENGVWTNNTLLIPELIAEFMRLWFEDSLPSVLFDEMKLSKGQYQEGMQVVKISEVYSSLIQERKNEFLLMLNNDKDE